MQQRITMKDLAVHFGVSLNTIHKAINGKPGISEDTRRRILLYAETHGYKRNAIAANLKKKELCIGISCPGKTEGSRYFYDDIWRGIRSYFQENEDYFHVRILELPYRPGEQAKQLSALLKTVFASQSSEAAAKAPAKSNAKKASSEAPQSSAAAIACSIDGLILTPPRGREGHALIRALQEKGAPFVFVTDDSTEGSGLGAVGADYYTAGRMMAEQFLNLRQEGGDVLLLSGDPAKDSHYRICQGFSDYNREQGGRLRIRNICGYHDVEQTKRDFLCALSARKPDLCGAVFATGSALISKVFAERGLAGTIPAIGNDLFAENIAALKNGIFTNLVFKDPERQGYLAAKMLCDYLFYQTEPAEKHVQVEASMIFKSNVGYYEARM